MVSIKVSFCRRQLLCWTIVLSMYLPSTGVAQESSVNPTSVERGWYTLRSVPYAKADLQADLFKNLWQVWPEQLKQQAQQADEPTRRQMSFSRYGMIVDPENPLGAPIGVVEDDQGGWAMNCLSCHQGKVAGLVIPGLGNSHFAFQTLVDDVYKAQQLNKQPGNPMSRMLQLGNSNGTTNAQVFSIFLTAMRDKNLNRVEVPQFPKYSNHDLDAPPFWHVKRKKNLYIDGFVPKTHRVIMQFALVPTNDRESFVQREDAFKDILDWIESLEAPDYPWPIDQALAMQGKTVFDRSCSDCHGTYGEDGSFPEIRVPIEDVGTDSVRLTGMPPEHRRFYSESWFGNFGELKVVEEPDGYVAPPLDGIWASAPYFHNGSVPTLWHVMNSSQRPAIWRRTEDGYDQRRVGLEVNELTEMPSGRLRPDEKRQYYNTSMSSKSAAGHLYPEALSEDEKTMLLEYLKTL